MHSINSHVNEGTLVFWPKALFRLLFVAVPVGAYSALLIYSELTRVYFSVKAGNGYVAVVILFCGGIAVWIQLACRKVIIYPECLTLQQTFPFKNVGTNYVWSSIADITEHDWFLLGKVLTFHRATGEKYGALWLSGWRHSRKLKQALQEKLQENGGGFEEKVPLGLFDDFKFKN